MGILDYISSSYYKVFRKPLINEQNVFTHMFNPTLNALNYWNQFENSPETVACVLAIAEDIIGDGYILVGGRNGKKKAEVFLEKNKFKQAIKSFLVDAIVTGDGYVYKMKFKDMTEVRSLISTQLTGRVPMEYKSLAVELKAQEMLKDGDLFSPRNFIYLASTTMRISHDENGNVLGYQQRIGKSVADFRADEVIHWKPIDLNGKMYGFTPMKTLSREIGMIADVKDYADYGINKNTTPSLVWILKNEIPGSPTYLQIKASLKQFETTRNRFKSLILCTGPEGVETKELNPNSKDMQFRELMKAMTQVIISVWGIPATRLPGIVAESGVKAAPSEEGYWGKISHYQDMLEDVVNSELIPEFDVKLRFKRTYKIDEIKESQAEMFKLDNMFKMNTLLSQHDKMLTLESIMSKIGIDEEQITAYVESKVQFENNRQDQISNKEINREGSEKNKPDEKRKETQQNKKI